MVRTRSSSRPPCSSQSGPSRSARSPSNRVLRSSVGPAEKEKEGRSKTPNSGNSNFLSLPNNWIDRASRPRAGSLHPTSGSSRCGKSATQSIARRARSVSTVSNKGLPKKRRVAISSSEESSASSPSRDRDWSPPANCRSRRASMPAPVQKRGRGRPRKTDSINNTSQSRKPAPRASSVPASRHKAETARSSNTTDTDSRPRRGRPPTRNRDLHALKSRSQKGNGDISRRGSSSVATGSQSSQEHPSAANSSLGGSTSTTLVFSSSCIRDEKPFAGGFSEQRSPSANGRDRSCSSTERSASTDKRGKKAGKKSYEEANLAALDLELPDIDIATEVAECKGKVDEEAVQMYREARDKVKAATVVSEGNRIESVVLGNVQIEVHHRSPYPRRFAILEKIFVCSACFDYFESLRVLKNHMRKCPLFKAPPGDEIYRDTQNKFSVFLVHGAKQMLYCNNLCRLTMFWLEDKVIWADVEPFSFYVLTSHAHGIHVPVGYFSRQVNDCRLDRNLSCFCVFPCYQSLGLGFLLVDFSFLLSRLECRPGGPERPLSTQGGLIYATYWREAVILALDDYWNTHQQQIPALGKLSQLTGICLHDLIETLTNQFGAKHHLQAGLSEVALSPAEFTKEAESIRAKNRKRALARYLEPKFRAKLEQLGQLTQQRAQKRRRSASCPRLASGND